MFNKFYCGITKQGMFLEVPLKGASTTSHGSFQRSLHQSGWTYFLPPLVFPRMARMAGQLSFICFWRTCPRQTLLVWQPPHTSITSKCFRTWFSPVSALSLVTPQYGQKATCLRFPPTVRDVLLRHSLR